MFLWKFTLGRCSVILQEWGRCVSCGLLFLPRALSRKQCCCVAAFCTLILTIFFEIVLLTAVEKMLLQPLLHVGHSESPYIELIRLCKKMFFFFLVYWYLLVLARLQLFPPVLLVKRHLVRKSSYQIWRPFSTLITQLLFNLWLLMPMPWLQCQSHYEALELCA